MKKLLIASTALSLAGGAAFAEMAITVGGSAELGLDYESEPVEGMSKHKFVHDFGVTFEGSGTTDGGLTFGATAGFDNKSGGGSFDDGSVSVSGSFGTLSIGDVGRGIDLAGGIEDVGMNDIGVDDMVEDLREGTAKQIRYGNTFGQISIAISAGTKDGSAMVPGKDAVPARYAPEHTIPAIVIEGEDPSRWYVKGLNDQVHTFSVNPIEPIAEKITTDLTSRYDEVFGIMITANAPDSEADPSVVTMVIVDSDGDGTDNDATDIFGFSRGKKSDVEGATGIFAAPVDGADPVEQLTGTHDKAIADFMRYEAAYHLGDDMTVGGKDVAADEENEVEAKNNVDMKKIMGDESLVSDNGVDEEEFRPEQKVGGELIAAEIPAVEPVPAVKSDTQYSFGMNFDAGGVTIGVGYDSEKTVSMGASFSAGEVSSRLLYVKTDDDTTGIGADMKYTMGASAITLAYGRQKPETGEAMDAVGMGVTHSLGGGATLSAGFGKVNEANKASIGIKFAF